MTNSAEPLTCEISAVSFAGFSIRTQDGRPARLAIIDEDGKIIDASATVSEHAWAVAIQAHREFLKGHGHLRVYATPPSASIGGQRK